MADPVLKDLVSEGLGRLISQWEDAPNLQGLLKSLLEANQSVEDCLYEMLTERDVYTAVGVNLDNLGALLGVLRQGRDDATYRSAILSQGTSSTSGGTPSDVLTTIDVVTKPSEVCDLFEHYPKNVHAITDGSVDRFTYSTVKNSMPAGTSLQIYFDLNDSLIPADLGVSKNLLITNTGDNVAVDTGAGIFQLSVNTQTTEGFAESSYLPDLIDEQEGLTINPLCDILVPWKETLSDLITQDNDDVVTESDDNIAVLTYEAATVAEGYPFIFPFVLS